ncbi:MAG TPA: ubiquinol oxidase subunit II [Janthinobacterium sp.]|nr:ubiquinol oxidase subunit II [Janthinobacterium sp.]
MSLAPFLALSLLAGCDTVLMKPSGDVAAQEGRLIVLSTLLMLLIIIPVIILTIVFAWRYRQQNTSAVYEPDWHHSTSLELVIWGAPLLIIIALGLLTWISTHVLDPYRPLQRLDENRAVAPGTRPLVVEVVALDWKWLFIYPELGIASVNELVMPVDVPVHYKITASSVMNSFFVPAMAGQIYAMAGMETTLHAVINRTGVFEGFSANYSGAGFSYMRFKLHGVAAAGFERWVAAARSGGGMLDRAAYLQLARPSLREPVRHYSAVAPDLYYAILNRCVAAGTVCMDKTAAADMHRAMGHAHE